MKLIDVQWHLPQMSNAEPTVSRMRWPKLCATGLSNTEVARRLHVTGATVCKWRQRFVQFRLDGLLDEPRPGTNRRLSDAAVEGVLARTLENPAAGRNPLVYPLSRPSQRPQPKQH